jgi:periplasmic divalent cation tolerance protein
MQSAHFLVLSTCPDRETARAIAARLVENRFAACVNMVRGVTSLYRWKGRIEEGEEILLLIKTTRGRYREVEECIRASHPYEVPEVIALGIEHGLASYLAWIGESCQ